MPTSVLRFSLLHTRFSVRAAVETGIFDRQRGTSSVSAPEISLVLQLVVSLMMTDPIRAAVGAEKEIQAADSNLFVEDL